MASNLLIVLLVLLCLISFSSCKLEFVSEICRHGARAPEGDNFGVHYKNGKGMLTSSGFRQHLMIGDELRNRYVKGMPKSQNLLSSRFDPEEVYVRSTQVERTVQSAYAQLLGMFPLGTAEDLRSDQIDVSTPPLNVHDLEDIITELGTDAVQDGMQPVTVKNYGLYIDSLIGYGGCPYIVNDYLRRIDDPQFWQDHDDYFRPLVFNQIAKAFNIDIDDLSFMKIYKYSDALFAENFEGVSDRFNFTSKEWEIVKSMQVPILIQMLSPYSSQILSLRYLFPILELMKSRMGQDYNKELLKSFGTPKFLLFSSHDYQLSHIMQLLNPENFQLEHVEFASILLFELHRRDTKACRDSSEDACYYVKAIFNDIQLKLPSCSSIDCSFTEFKGYIESFGMTYDQMIEICFSEEPLESDKYDEKLRVLQ
ncbi:unnamed protein product [Moneuplotes crassus]|uniref:Acid phosphatase n=1 Tax=Euplotes crassus TaxID=5936 RepID=A0AAD1UQ92_EUPCR|nr:unnamed protein product [Moneuplotes crassus]